MLIIPQGGTATLTVTLYENCISMTPSFTWFVERKGSLDSIIFCQDDISAAPYYFNQFYITVATSSVGLTQGLIPLSTGEWNYTIYEQDQPYVLATSSTIVETGILQVLGTFSQLVVYGGDLNPSVDAIKVYRGN